MVSTLGGRGPDGRRGDEEGDVNVIDAAAAHGVGRFVLVTSIGCGDMAPFRSERAITAFGAAVDRRPGPRSTCAASCPRRPSSAPGALRSEPATGRGLLTRDPQTHGFIGREDVAAQVARVLGDPAAWDKPLPPSTPSGRTAAADAAGRAFLRRHRPPRGLRSEPATGRSLLTRDPQTHGFIGREDVAGLVARMLGDPAASGQAFAAVDAEWARRGGRRCRPGFPPRPLSA